MQSENVSPSLLFRNASQILTKTETRLADWIDAHRDEALKGTVSDFAKEAHCSEITVSRFCKKLGFNGIQDLKLALVKEWETVDDDVIVQDILRTDPYDVIASKMFRNISDGLQDTMRLLDYADVAEAVRLLADARKIDIYGFGNSATVCKDMETRFLRFGMAVQAYSDAHLQVTSAALLTPEDVVVAISHTGRSIDLLHSVDVVKKAGAKVIGITSYSHSELAKRTDIILQGMGREINYQSESVASRFIHMAIIDLLYVGIAIRFPERYRENIRKMRAVITEKKV